MSAADELGPSPSVRLWPSSAPGKGLALLPGSVFECQGEGPGSCIALRGRGGGGSGVPSLLRPAPGGQLSLRRSVGRGGAPAALSGEAWKRLALLATFDYSASLVHVF